MYAEYTPGITDRTHISADVMRYQTTISAPSKRIVRRTLNESRNPCPRRGREFSMPWTRMRLLGSAFHGAAVVSRKISRQFGGVSTSTFPWPARPCNS